jgi:hypothetical protein
MVRQTGVVGVFRDEGSAHEAAAAARRAGASPSVIRVGDPRDRIVALRADMTEELETTLMGPGSVGPFTKEQTDAMVPLTIIFGIVGALVALPFAAFEFGDFPTWGRLVVLAIVGAAFGSLIGFQIGGMYGARRPEEPRPVEQGVTVAIDVAPGPAVDVLRSMHPLQLDAIDEHGRSLGSIVVPDDTGRHGGVVEELGEHMRDRRLEG